MTDSDQDDILHKIKQLEETVEQQSEEIESVKKEKKIIESRLNHLNDYTEELEEMIIDNVESIEDINNIVLSGDKIHLTPAEEILTGNDWSNIHVTKSPNRERAIKVLEEWDVKASYVGNQNMQRLYVKQIKDIIDAPHSTAQRVAEAIQDLTEHKIELYDTKEMKQRPNMNDYLLLDDILITSKEDIRKLKQNK